MMCIQISTQKFRIFQNSGTKKNYSRRIAEIFPRGFHQVSEKPHQFYFDQVNSKKTIDRSGNESKENKNKGKRVTQYSNTDIAQIIYEYDMLEAFLLGSGGNHQSQHIKKQVKHNPDTLNYLIYAWGCSNVSLSNFHPESVIR